MTKYSLLITETDGTKEQIPLQPNSRLVSGSEWFLLNTGTTAENVNRKPPYKDRDWLNIKYHSEDLTLQQIGDMCGVSPMTVNQWLVKHQIPSRPRGRRKE